MSALARRCFPDPVDAVHCKVLPACPEDPEFVSHEPTSSMWVSFTAFLPPLIIIDGIFYNVEETWQAGCEPSQEQVTPIRHLATSPVKDVGKR